VNATAELLEAPTVLLSVSARLDAHAAALLVNVMESTALLSICARLEVVALRFAVACALLEMALLRIGEEVVNMLDRALEVHVARATAKSQFDAFVT
jgi:hypothetical protein